MQLLTDREITRVIFILNGIYAKILFIFSLHIFIAENFQTYLKAEQVVVPQLQLCPAHGPTSSSGLIFAGLACTWVLFVFSSLPTDDPPTPQTSAHYAHAACVGAGGRE